VTSEPDPNERESLRLLLTQMIARTPIGEYPLSLAQQRLWFMDRLQPGSPLYNVPMVLPLQGRVQPTLLDRALNLLVARHEALRTTFHMRGGQPVQVVAEQLEIDLEVVDLSVVPAGERDLFTQRTVSAEARAPFDLEHGPLLRARLLSIDPDRHLLLLSLHHIVSDGWSMTILLRELSQSYVALLQGGKPNLPPLPIQYGEFARRQRQQLDEAKLEALTRYWVERLAGIDEGIDDLPTDFIRPRTRGYKGAHVDISIPSAVVAPFMQACRARGATVFMGLLAGLVVVLHRYTGREDICIGTPIANRTSADVENLIGFFVNTLVMRVGLNETPTFLELLDRVRECTLEAYTHQDLPYAHLVELLRPTRDTSRNPIFQMMLVLQNLPGAGAPAADTPAVPLDLGTGTSKFDITLTLGETAEGGLQGGVEYDPDLFRRSTIEQLGRHLRLVMADTVRRPELSITDIKLADHEELTRLAKLARGPTGGLKRSVLDQIVSRATAHPTRIALEYGGQQVTYGELLGRAAGMMAALVEAGARHDDRIAILLPGSIQLVVAALGAWLAGCSYVPLDPASPVDRLVGMLADGGARLLVTDRRDLVGCAPVELVAPEQPALAWPAHAVRHLGEAYTMFTSGSTGRPKGVAISHDNLAWFVAAMEAVLPMACWERFAQAASPAFDATTIEIWCTLALGGTVVGLRRDEVLSPRLSADLQARGISGMYLTAALFHQAAPRLPNNLSSIRAILIGGDVVDPGLACELAGRLPACAIVHVYGPTETTVLSSIRLVTSGEPPPRTLPIGTPLPDSASYVLDADLHPCPMGVPGDLWIGGDCVGIGYVGLAARTAERFRPDPYAQRPGSRMYLTGDRARWLSSGELEFLGRSDDQVKIRGFRVEPAEVAHVISRAPGVDRAVVVVHGAQSDDKRLVAYVASARPDRPSISDLHRFVERHLPPYMSPSAWVVLDTLPLGTAGKVDLAQLPPPPDERPDLQAPFTPPTDAVEEVLSALWMELMNLPQVGILDNFFELGGHSLMATQLVARITDAFDIKFPLRTVFEAPTIREQAEHLRLLAEPGEIRRMAELILTLSKMSDTEVEALTGHRGTAL